jgi:hypothetical protein
MLTDRADAADTVLPPNAAHIRGLVALAHRHRPVAGVTVTAFTHDDLAPAARAHDRALGATIGSAVTGADGTFDIAAGQADPADPHLARWLCAAPHCASLTYTLRCTDRDGSLLLDTEPLPLTASRETLLLLTASSNPPQAEHWMAFGETLEEHQLLRLGEIATELATLAPRGVFATMGVQQRVATLGALEQALLDPEQRFAQSGITLSVALLDDDDALQALQERLRQAQRPDLLETLDKTVTGFRTAGGWDELDIPVAVERFKRGDYLSGVNQYIEHPGLFPGIVGGAPSPTIGYRDYLRNRWIDNQRFRQVLGAPDQQLATRGTMIQRLNGRFHQDFATGDLTQQPANRILVRVLQAILVAPGGTGYGFGIVPATIQPQGTQGDRDYLDYLISLTGYSAQEIENRYRLNLRRTDFELSNPVQQNIETLQRFFTDSYQSDDDAYAVKPDRDAGTDERLITRFPREAAGPFFLEYEEWLAREEPFFPENHYDPRATFFFATDDRPSEKARDAVFARSIAVADFLTATDKSKFVPNGSNHAGAKWQWARNLLELQDLLGAAHTEARTLNYVGAEQKYALAKEWARQMRTHLASDWDYTAKRYTRWDYAPLAVSNEQKKADVSTMDKLRQYEARYHLYLGWRVPQASSDFLRDGTGAPTEINARWWGDRPDLFPGPGYRGTIAYLLDHLYFRVVPACLSEVLLSQGKYAEALRELVGSSHVYRQEYWWFTGPAGFNIFAGNTTTEPFVGHTDGRFNHYTGGPLPYASDSPRTQYPAWDNPHLFPTIPPTSVPTNRAELGYYKLKLGNVALEWADVLYRSNQPDAIMRARELYKAVLYLHGEDPELNPHWDRRGLLLLLLPWAKSKRNPAIVGQVSRAQLGFLQINAGLNFYGIAPTHVPPVRFRVLKEAADRFAAGARGAQSDFLGYMEKVDQLTVAEMQARTMVTKATAAVGIAQEQQKVAEFHVGEAQKQVDAINAQIAAKKAEIAKKDEFFEQWKDFAGGMKDSVGKLAEVAFAGDGAAGAATAGGVSTGDLLKLGFKVGTASNALGGATSALGGAAGVAGPFGAFLYAGVTTMSSLADAVAKRAAELAHLEKVALPAAKALVELKKRDVTIAQLSQAIARADQQLGNDLLKHYAQRFLNRAFLVSMAEFSSRLMRRYLDLAGRTAWLAERALAFEQDRLLEIIALDYFPRALRGVTGADQLQLHLAELEAARIQGLTQTIPVKQTVSLARDFPIAFGQLKKHGRYHFVTREQPLQLSHPGVYGYRVRNVTVSASYAAPIQPHRGLVSNHGVSSVTRQGAGSAHVLTRFPDALPLSEFRMREDMWVFDLPDETLLPFEGSGIETEWELMLATRGNAEGLSALTDILFTFDMRASYSATLRAQHLAAVPATMPRSLLASGRALNPGIIASFATSGGVLALDFDLAPLLKNPADLQRTVKQLVVIAVGVDDAPIAATFASTTPAQSMAITLEKGVALSNAGVLADGNAGVPLPLTNFVEIDVGQRFALTIDDALNPGVDFSALSEVLLLVEYEATF